MSEISFFQVAAILSPILTGSLAYLAFRRNQKIDDSADAREKGEQQIKLESIEKKTERIETEIGNLLEKMDRKLDKIDSQMSESMVRLAVVERDTNRAHSRIETLAGMVGGSGKV